MVDGERLAEKWTLLLWDPCSSRARLQGCHPWVAPVLGRAVQQFCTGRGVFSVARAEQHQSRRVPDPALPLGCSSSRCSHQAPAGSSFTAFCSSPCRRGGGKPPVLAACHSSCCAWCGGYYLGFALCIKSVFLVQTVTFVLTRAGLGL